MWAQAGLASVTAQTDDAAACCLHLDRLSPRHQTGACLGWRKQSSWDFGYVAQGATFIEIHDCVTEHESIKHIKLPDKQVEKTNSHVSNPRNCLDKKHLRHTVENHHPHHLCECFHIIL